MLNPAKTVEIYQRSEPKTFSAGETIFEVGRPKDYMYGVLEGEVELWVNGTPIETIQAGDVFGEGALVHPSGSRASTAIAKTDCKLAYLDEERFLFAIQETPVFALQVMRSFSDRLRRLKGAV
ncbi:cyclic nucleotide-binding domain-containing protein [Desertifilum sp. FACHB-1129]|uniref:Cyclic nucleotide-binding protein n=1 Tax=Desertifilum tharense IPPAS B-1220 TaxID=1781255 RepID=A0A1E5QF28_9CYAN|nr:MULTISPECIES: cyclic nucleotide-binding domain-containing protein [Desertifilum]MDA0211438.1 cyclic nucleotide-binding domain-containing protein [Cyanobacteria bacterium FC1]MBD2313515.1 cyclic nucleotide-binding domain-containing protein [Desertifilum sp. FACHB-1129]MBD2323847.1 cyclic nucleotide-binding domain-containing protein [Desertifilum sp. FACHB-866]MBD2333692.1 cyclic nucleotide-binding domain-containing protein [Desertifilum sp. FACHB-868]OEJ72943.1 cyclic nucleotide-binding prot